MREAVTERWGAYSKSTIALGSVEGAGYNLDIAYRHNTYTVVQTGEYLIYFTMLFVIIKSVCHGLASQGHNHYIRLLVGFVLSAHYSCC